VSVRPVTRLLPYTIVYGDFLFPLHLLSLYGSADRLVLLSFPTRRSSDLRVVSHRPRLDPDRQVRSRDVPHPGGAGATGAPVDVRSEEHTSELQSRFEIVCRLLLEKKKKCTWDELTMSVEKTNPVANVSSE